MKNQNEENLRKELEVILKDAHERIIYGFRQALSGDLTPPPMPEKPTIDQLMNLFHSREKEIREEVMEVPLNDLEHLLRWDSDCDICHHQSHDSFDDRLDCPTHAIYESRLEELKQKSS